MLVVFVLMFLFFAVVTTTGVVDVVQSIRYGETAVALSVAAGTVIAMVCTAASLVVLISW